MAKSPNWLDVEHRPIENGAGDREIPAEGRIGWLSGKSRLKWEISDNSCKVDRIAAQKKRGDLRKPCYIIANIGLSTQMIQYREGYLMNSDQSAQLSICEKCKSNIGKPFTFYYGTTIRISETINGNTRTTRTTYKIGGSKAAVICDKCHWKQKIKSSSIALSVTLLGVLIFILGIKNGNATPFSAIGALLGIVSIIVSLYFINPFTKDIAESMAIRLNWEKLRSEGFDKCWIQRDYRKLENQNLSSTENI